MAYHQVGRYFDGLMSDLKTSGLQLLVHDYHCRASTIYPRHFKSYSYAIGKQYLAL